MTKILTFIFLIFSSLTNHAQESITFKAKINPNRTYKTQLNTSSYSEININADQEIIDRFESQGVKLPMIMEDETNMTTELVTLQTDKNGEFPAKMTYNKWVSTTTLNGETTTKEKPYSGTIISGKYDVENKFKIDTIIGDKVSDKMRSTLKSILENIQQTIAFPEKPMKIGDNFKSEMPMTIPMEGMNPIYLKISVEYLLKEIKGNKAIFDIKQTVGLDMNQEQVNVVATGGGNGTSEYDIKENYLTKYSSKLPMDVTVVINEKMTMKMKMDITTEQNVIIE